eukprot:gene12219-8408_t
MPTNISVQDLHALIQKDKNLFLVDVREEGEYRREHVEQATLYPLSSLDPVKVFEAAGKRDLYVMCAAGGRSATASKKLEEAAKGKSTKVFNVTGGMSSWRSAHLPVVENKSAPPSLSSVRCTLIASTLILSGSLLSRFYDPNFIALPDLRGMRPGGVGCHRFLRHGLDAQQAALPQENAERSSSPLRLSGHLCVLPFIVPGVLYIYIYSSLSIERYFALLRRRGAFLPIRISYPPQKKKLFVFTRFDVLFALVFIYFLLQVSSRMQRSRPPHMVALRWSNIRRRNYLSVFLSLWLPFFFFWSSPMFLTPSCEGDGEIIQREGGGERGLQQVLLPDVNRST